jgi:hypothetical protein
MPLPETQALRPQFSYEKIKMVIASSSFQLMVKISTIVHVTYHSAENTLHYKSLPGPMACYAHFCTGMEVAYFCGHSAPRARGPGQSRCGPWSQALWHMPFTSISHCRPNCTSQSSNSLDLWTFMAEYLWAPTDPPSHLQIQLLLWLPADSECKWQKGRINYLSNQVFLL